MPAAATARACAVTAVLGWGAFQNLYRLDSADWLGDELTYHFAGWEYAQGNFAHNFDHPFTGKLVLGAAQSVLGSTQGQARLVPAIASMLTGLLIFALLRPVAGLVAALVGLGGWLVLPHSAPGVPVRIDRFGLLEPLLALLVFTAVAAGWQWTTRSSWPWALATGAAAGLAVTTKATALLVLPVVVLTAVVVRRDERAVAQTLGCLTLAQLVAIGSYAVAGSRGAEAVRYMFEKQAAHHDAGHLVTVAGVEYVHPPWWSHLWWQTQSYGTAGTVAIVLLALAGVVGGGRLGRYLLAAVLFPLAGLSFGVGFALPFYYLVWQPPLMALVGIGAGRLCRRWAGRVVASAALVPLLVLGVTTSGELLDLRPSSYDLLVATELDELTPPVGHVVLVLGNRNRVAVLFEPRQPVLTWVPPKLPVAAVVVECAAAARYPRSPVLAYLRWAGPRMAATRVDDLLVYLPKGASAAGRSARC